MIDKSFAKNPAYRNREVLIKHQQKWILLFYQLDCITGFNSRRPKTKEKTLSMWENSPSIVCSRFSEAENVQLPESLGLNNHKLERVILPKVNLFSQSVTYTWASKFLKTVVNSRFSMLWTTKYFAAGKISNNCLQRQKIVLSPEFLLPNNQHRKFFREIVVKLQKTVTKMLCKDKRN